MKRKRNFPEKKGKVIVSHSTGKVRARATMEKSHEIPEDVLIEILLRVPAHAILRFRILSKSHRALIDSPNFIKRHYHLTVKQRRTYAFIDNRVRSSGEGFNWMKFEAAYEANFSGKVYDHPFMDFHTYYLVGYCMGIFVFSYRSHSSYDILFWNPTTRRYRNIILKSHNVSQSYFLEYDSVIEYMKLLQIPFERDGDVRNLGAEELYIYSSRTDSLKRIKVFNNQLPNLRLFPSCNVFVEGTNCTHIPALDSGMGKILVFDFSSESFNLIHLPPSDVFITPKKVGDLSPSKDLFSDDEDLFTESFDDE